MMKLHIHKWKDATCTTPEMCVICGKTKNKAKGHSFTLWDNETIGLNAQKELEYRECKRCGAVEWRNIKAELSAAEADLMGSWHSVVMVRDGKVYEYDREVIMFASDNSGLVVVTNDGRKSMLTFNWKYSTGFSSDKKTFFTLKDNKNEKFIGHAEIIKDKAEKELYGQLMFAITNAPQVFLKKNDHPQT